METINQIIQKVQKVEHGFKLIQEEAQYFTLDHSTKECLKISKELYTSKTFQVRSLATFILGFIAAESEESLRFLKENVSNDEDWRVQEILAKSFDKYCSDIGYEKALPVIKEWLKDKNPNVRRAVTEGLRIWTSREYFRDNPEITIEILSQLRDDESEYVRKSVGNALKDISKKHTDFVKSEINTWDIFNKRIAQTYKHATKLMKLRKT